MFDPSFPFNASTFLTAWFFYLACGWSWLWVVEPCSSKWNCCGLVASLVGIIDQAKKGVRKDLRATWHGRWLDVRNKYNCLLQFLGDVNDILWFIGDLAWVHASCSGLLFPYVQHHDTVSADEAGAPACCAHIADERIVPRQQKRDGFQWKKPWRNFRIRYNSNRRFKVATRMKCRYLTVETGDVLVI